MGCRSCGGKMFDPAPVSPQALDAFVKSLEPLPAVVITPTLRGGVIQYPPEGVRPAAIDGFEQTGEATFESVMPPCKHRYEVMAIGLDGLTTVKHNCLHAESGHTNQYVSKSVCDGCPLRKGSQG